ncbi:MAG: tetratricopeptide repeat protein [Burkholderiaceae bacterium]|nr:MAG: tetratricopeptide repeat protein [Burkholderiaceae bacterium]
MLPSSKAPYWFALALLIAVLCIYVPGLNNELLFDDELLKNGTVFGGYGNLLDFKQRMLSYGSFVWIELLVGPGWWKQRIANIALHLGVIIAVHALLQRLMAHARFPQDMEEQPHFAASRAAALRVGLVLFALNPVAVYAVAYLAQRSILMATLFATLACWSFVKALETGRIGWYAGAVLGYALSVMSKEHAVMTAALAIPLYIFVRRPPARTLLLLTTAALLLLGTAAALLLTVYDDLIGRIFDAQSAAFAQQLEALRPGITQRIYPLSILNEAALFFGYGLRWLIPYTGWMSIDLRPPFPLGFASWQLAGAIGYIALLAGSIWALLRRRDTLALVAVCLLFPLLWYITEFATVWIQDPFVLYRSYLWAVTLPGLLAIALTGFQPRTIYILGLVLGMVLSTLAVERMLSLKDEAAVWADAAEKIDRSAPANAVGRSRPFLNLGAYQFRQGLVEQAERSLRMAQSLGDKGELGAAVHLSLGQVQQQRGQHAQALQAFATAEAEGLNNVALHYHRGESLYALGQLAPALQSFDLALSAAENNAVHRQQVPTLRLQRAEVALDARQYDQAIRDFRQLLQEQPNNELVTQGLARALAQSGKVEQAIALFDETIKRNPSDASYYGRAMVYYNTGRTQLALQDLDQAIRLNPRNGQYRQVRSQIATALRAVKP